MCGRCKISWKQNWRNIHCLTVHIYQTVLKDTYNKYSQYGAEPEWPSGLQRRACDTDGRRFEPWTSTNACGHICRHMDRKGLAARLTSVQSAGVAPEVNLRNSLHAGNKARKWGIHPGFETQGRRHQKSKTGVSVAPRKGLTSCKLKKKTSVDANKVENCEYVGTQSWQ